MTSKKRNVCDSCGSKEVRVGENLVCTSCSNSAKEVRNG
jgi:hypothetical protein